MRTRLLMCCAIFAGLSVFYGVTLAHHGNSAYDAEHHLTITGTVTEFVWSNPHCQIYMDVKDDSGNVVHWSVESQSPGILHRNGWTRDSIKAGDQITVVLIPAKNGAPVGFTGESWGKVTFADGRELKTDAR